MPHLIVEYSANVAKYHDIDGLLDVMQKATIELDVSPIPGIRIRAICHDQYRIADGSNPDHGFVAMVARIGPGRDDETKTRLIDTLLDAAEAQFATENSPLAIAWSMEVHEIDADFRVNRNHVKTRMDEATQ